MSVGTALNCKYCIDFKKNKCDSTEKIVYVGYVQEI